MKVVDLEDPKLKIVTREEQFPNDEKTHATLLEVRYTQGKSNPGSCTCLICENARQSINPQNPKLKSGYPTTKKVLHLII